MNPSCGRKVLIWYNYDRYIIVSDQSLWQGIFGFSYHIKKGCLCIEGEGRVVRLLQAALSPKMVEEPFSVFFGAYDMGNKYRQI